MAYLADLLEVADKVLLKVLVEVGSHQVGAAWVHTEDDGQVQPVSGRDGEGVGRGTDSWCLKLRRRWSR